MTIQPSQGGGDGPGWPSSLVEPLCVVLGPILFARSWIPFCRFIIATTVIGAIIIVAAIL